jgi:hypothetical protein
MPVPEVHKLQHPDPDERKVVLLEFLAASAIFLIVAVVLYMVFTYKPA